MSAGVGFQSSANQTSAAQAKKQKRRASITPLESKAATRAKLAGLQPRHHDAIRESWLEIIAIMRECVRPYPVYVPAPVEPVVKAPVVFEEIVAAYDDPDAIATVKQAAEVFEDIAPEPAPAVTPAPAMLLLMPPKIAGYLPARCGKSNYDMDAAAARAAIRAEWEAEHGETLPERTGVDVGQRKLWRRNPDGSYEKRMAS